jgi:hypothetical protein
MPLGFTHIITFGSVGVVVPRYTPEFPVAPLGIPNAKLISLPLIVAVAVAGLDESIEVAVAVTFFIA